MTAGSNAGLEQRGRLLAGVLAGTWRCSPSSVEISADELRRITPRLLETGAASLAWWRVRDTPLRGTPTGFRLQQAYRFHTLQAALYERDLMQAVTRLRSHGVEPVLVKGWAVARLYPERGLRPYVDLDLCVRPEQFSTAAAALKNLGNRQFPVDLHPGCPKPFDRNIDELYERSGLIPLGEVEVRVPSPEDHLRLLCLHMWVHSAWRPLWLCDLAVALASQQPDFDWDYCLRGNRRFADWVACALGLTHQLLGACLDQTPVAKRAHHLPRWLVPAVLRQWGASSRGSKLLALDLRHPARVWSEVRNRWPNPIQATVDVRGPFNELPRLLFQVGSFLTRSARFAARLPQRLQARP